jgi:Tfp pilus assembly protein PilW
MTESRINFAIQSDTESGFSLIELIMAMLVTLVILGAAVAAFSGALRMREEQSSRTDALTSAQAAINIMTREIGNSGYGLLNGQFGSNGLVLADCNATRLHFRANVNNSNAATSDPGEDVTYYYDPDSLSVVRFDAANGGSTAGVINRVSSVQFIYHNYATNGTSTAGAASAETGRVTIRLTVIMDGDDVDVVSPRNVTFESDVTLRNSPYGLGQY